MELRRAKSGTWQFRAFQWTKNSETSETGENGLEIP